MKKCLLVFALLLCLSCAHADGGDYYTNNKDIYYHTDPDCDRPVPVETELGGTQEIYARACYQKYPISAEAAAEFEKKACPICVKHTEPVYLGEHMMEWEYDFNPWDGGDRHQEWGEAALGPQEYQAEVQDTRERFEAYFEEVYNRKTGEYERKHPYPDAYAGCWVNNADGYTYAVVDPTPEILDSFKELFGGGAWIVPAKYGYNEIKPLLDDILTRIQEWSAEHSDIDLRGAYAGMDGVNSRLTVAIYAKEDKTWEQGMPLLDAELDLPIWVSFIRDTSYFDEENMWAIKTF